MYVNKLDFDPNREINESFLSACLIGDLKEVDNLLSDRNNADIHYKDDDGFTGACVNGHLHIVRYLLTSPKLKEKIDIKAYNDLGLIMACENNHLNIVKYLLESKELGVHADINTYNNYAFLLVAKKGFFDLMVYLLSFNTSSQEQLEVFFMEACRNGQYHIVQYFIFNLNFKLNKMFKIHLNESNITFVKQQIEKRKLFNELKKLSKNIVNDVVKKV